MTTLQINTQIPALIHNLEVCLRSGYNVKQALEISAKDLPEPLASETAQVYSEIETGTPILEALDRWYDHHPSPELDLMIATLKVQLEVGGNLADKFRLLGQILEKRRALN